ncbi:MAG: DUF5752 family protein, partial [Deltaproteobacteria bacterium]
MAGLEISPFAIKDCALIAIATGKRARNLRELRECLRSIDSGSIYYHFWGGLVRPRFDDPEYHNDFAIWIARSLHNKALAERLAIIDPVAYGSMETVRNELIDIIEESLDETEFPTWAKRDDQFEFMQHQIVVFDTRMTANTPLSLLDILPEMSFGSIFYHLVDARHRNENSLDDFHNWVRGFGSTYDTLCQMIHDICPYFTSLKDLRA